PPQAPTTMQPLTAALRRHHPAPDFTLPEVRLRDYSFRRDLVLAMLHGPDCSHCARIARELDAQRADREDWGTTLLVLRRDPEPFPDAPGIPRQARDADGAVYRRYAGEDDPDAQGVLLLVLDHRGRFMDGWILRHPEPVDWHEVAETVRWVAIQEPECGNCSVLPAWDAE
ncbi:MAG TPA: hypothetical protein VM490_02355, partial [Armatimonadaceae bacterium]|nr:hypothetical protein [Armatimonadaceae bacterium]